MMFSKVRLLNRTSQLIIPNKNFGFTSRNNFRQTKNTKQVLESAFKSYESMSAAKTFQIVGAVSSATGIGILCYYALKKSESFSIVNKASVWPAYVRDRIHSTYTYFALSNVVTAGTALAIFRNPTLFKYATRATIPSLLLGLVGVIGTGMVMRSIPYDGSIGPKHLAWLIHCGTLGFVVAPVCMLGGQIIQRAALYTLGIVGGLSAVAVTAPSDKFLYMGVPLGMGLGLVFVSSLAGMFLNPVSRVGAAVMSFQIYGGLILFGGFLLYDTQNIVRRAETHPPPLKSYDGLNQVPLYDPINNAMSIYLDTLNIFIRLATIMGMGSSKKR